MAAKAKDIIKYLANKAVDRAVEKPMDKAMTMAVDKVDGIDNIERDIAELQKTLLMVEGMVPLAEEKQINNVYIQNWLRDLIDIGYEARDVLEDFIAYSSCIRVESSSRLVIFISSQISFLLSYFGGLSSDTSELPLTVLNQLEKDIRSVRERFDEKKKEGETFATLESVVGEGSESVKNRKPVGPFINKQRDGLFLGREDVKKGIMDKILHPSDDLVHVVVIWGMGGIGKTTLAQSIYNNESVKLVPRSWLCVGVNKFSAEKVIKEIVNDQNTIGIGKLQEKLVKELRGDRFLIVLDDVWDVDGNQWDLLFNPLTEVGKGGLIIITRRERDVCPAAITIQTAYNLEPLSEEDSWLIFESCAYVNGKSDSTPDLKCIGENIVKKLNGHPLALKVVGRSLLNKDYSTWTNFLEFKFSEDDEVMSALRWSYNHLSPHLKMCFTYCSLFPEDHVLDKKVLVEMWMAHDLIQTEKQKRPEDVGAQYFEQLVNASLLQCVDGKHVMHDLIHDLALLVSNGEFASANSSLTDDKMKKVRHITITSSDYSKMEKLLTLYDMDKRLDKFFLLTHNDIFKLKSIRVLVLSSECIYKIPDCINELKHLRYLDVSKTRVKSLPDSLCHLYNLQMLAAPLDAQLPIDIVNISSLRHLRANLSTCKGVGKLISLQELSSIHVCEGDNIRELGDMQRLRGKLTIKGLENVEKLEDTVAALMENQTLMDELELVFNQHSAESIISDEEVLDSLGCPPNLTYLRIAGYNGLKPPSWMVDGKHKFHKLQTLVLDSCSKLESLPPLGEFANFMTSLSNLKISKCDGLKRLQLDALVSLKELTITHCSSLVQITSAICEELRISSCRLLETMDVARCDSLQVVIKILKFEDCESLTSLSIDIHGLDSLEHLGIHLCPKLELAFQDGSSSSSSSRNSVAVPLHRISTNSTQVFRTLLHHELLSLKYLNITNLGGFENFDETEANNFCKLRSLKGLGLWQCMDLKSLPVDFHKLSSLKSLGISCPQLQSLPPDFHKLSSLENIYIDDCPQLQSLPPDFHKLSSLKKLDIHCPQLQSLPPDFHKLPSLQTLYIYNSPKLQSLPPDFHKLSSLEFLDINSCPLLQSLPPDFYKLSSLKDLNIIGCSQLQSLPPDFHKLSSLKRLRILYSPKLQSLPPDFHKLSSLEKLYIDDCPQLQSLPPNFHKLSSLQELNINHCPQLQSLCPDFHKLSSLKSLCIIDCPQLQLLPPDFHKLSSLVMLSIDDCPELKSLTPDFHNLSSLKDLIIINCPQLQSLPADGFPPSIRRLSIIGCPLLYERCRDESGPDRHKINHILEKDIRP